MTSDHDEQARWLAWLAELQGIARAGLTYAKDTYDQERYEQLMTLTSQMAAHGSGLSQRALHMAFRGDLGYLTPNVCSRVFIWQNNRVLLVKERSEDVWTLPGGWVDVNESPAESAAREAHEETGYAVKIIRLLALWDKLKHDHPPAWPHVHQYFFHGEIIGGELRLSHEISAVDFFSLDHLPSISLDRVTASQMRLLSEIVKNDLPVMCD